MDQAEHTLRTNVQRMLEQGRRDQDAFLAEISDAERAAFGQPDHWSVRDHINHINFWRERLLQIFAAMPTRIPPQPITDSEAMNQAIFAERRQLAWDDILKESARLMDAIDAYLAQMSDADLTDPSRYFTPGTQTLQSRVVHFGYEHPLSHYVQLRRERGDHDGAVRQQRAAIALTEQLLGRGEAYAILVYNLACLYAVIDEPEHALATLRDVFAMLPAQYHAEWQRVASEDSELTSLHAYPEFQALIRDAQPE